MPYTRLFRDQELLLYHFQKHGKKVGAADLQHYELLADTFLGEPIDATKQQIVLECITDRGEVLRFNIITEEYGVLAHDKYIRTYYIPDLADHDFPTNYHYFLDRCRQP